MNMTTSVSSSVSSDVKRQRVEYDVENAQAGAGVEPSIHTTPPRLYIVDGADRLLDWYAMFVAATHTRLPLISPINIMNSNDKLVHTLYRLPVAVQAVVRMVVEDILASRRGVQPYEVVEFTADLLSRKNEARSRLFCDTCAARFGMLYAKSAEARMQCAINYAQSRAVWLAVADKMKM